MMHGVSRLIATCERRFVVIAVAVCCALHLVALIAKRAAQGTPGSLVVHAEGTFVPNGEFPGEAYTGGSRVRRWGSWAGADMHAGRLTIGPFAAPSQLSFDVSGYPRRQGNELFVEHVATKSRLPIEAPDVGERWQRVTCTLPVEWHGDQIIIVAVDGNTGWGGWLALTEPHLASRKGWTPISVHRLSEAFAAWAWNGLLLGVAWLAAARLLTRVVPIRSGMALVWLPLMATGVLATAGYLLFWGYFAHPLLGQSLTAALLIASIICIWRRTDTSAALLELRTVGGPTILVGVFYLGVLYLFPTQLDFHTLAAERFASLPSDNAFPYFVADRLLHGGNMKATLGDWLVSDRPPLQSGWMLLTWPALAALRLDPNAATGTSAMWFQLAWIAAVYGLLRTLGVSQRRSVAWVTVLALSGFFILHSTYTWPKLGAGAFACGAFGLWVLNAGPGARRDACSAGASAPPRVTTIHTIAGAALAALAWLSHGGVAFSFLALVPWIAWRCRRGDWRRWLIAAFVFGVFTAPWAAYQKFYDPPGNRLLKWHLAGQLSIDSRGTWQALRENYAAIGWKQAWENKRLNFEAQAAGTWRHLFAVSPARVQDRRNEEFFLPARALTWWLAGLVLVPFALWRLLRQTDSPAPRGLIALLLWPAVTIPLWCLLMFVPHSAVIHQGSFAVMMALFVVATVAFEHTARGWLVIIALLQTFTFVTTWTTRNPAGEALTDSAFVAWAPISGVAFVACIVISSRLFDAKRAAVVQAPR